ncbi:MAG: Crp/Fnr family transcriptional regulator [Bacteroidales bacterium]|nr:Crp/Fnr family transcriptional regulator [Bacteroidales bacterium]
MMDKEELKHIERYLFKYVNFKPAEIMALEDITEIRYLKKNEIFVNQSDIAKEIAFTMSGYLRVYYNHDGDEITRDITPLHSFVTALPSYITQTPSFEIISAITDCKLIIIQKKDLENLYHTYPNWERFGRLTIEEMFVESQNRIYSFITEPAADRYKKLMKHHPDMIKEVPLKYLADFIGIKLQSLSRLRKSINW